MPTNLDRAFNPDHPEPLSANGHWVFGSVYAGLALVGFAFGVWAGAAKPKPVEVADARKDAEKPAPKPPVTNPKDPATIEPKKEPEPKPPEPEPKAKEPDPKPKEPEPKPKEPAPKPKPKAKEPEPKKPDRVVVFKDVQPIFRAYCNDCHGGSTGKPKGDVDLTSVAKILKSKGPPLVAGKPAESTLYSSIKSMDMPPDGKKGPSDKELQLIYDWIAGGAKERRRPIRGRTSGARAVAPRRCRVYLRAATARERAEHLKKR